MIKQVGVRIAIDDGDPSNVVVEARAFAILASGNVVFASNPARRLKHLANNGAIAFSDANPAPEDPLAAHVAALRDPNVRAQIARQLTEVLRKQVVIEHDAGMWRLFVALRKTMQAEGVDVRLDTLTSAPFVFELPDAA